MALFMHVRNSGRFLGNRGIKMEFSKYPHASNNKVLSQVNVEAKTKAACFLCLHDRSICLKSDVQGCPLGYGNGCSAILLVDEISTISLRLWHEPLF